jgi:outer membrane beta-barrel protein
MTTDGNLPRTSAALAALAALALLAAPRPAAAQSKSDAFAGKIPPVAGALYQKAGRFELTGTGNLSLNDAFFAKYFAGAKLGYHFTEALSLAATFATGTSSATGSAVVCPSNGGCGDAAKQQLWQVPGDLKMMAGLEAAWAPVYGKLNVFSEKVAHFDLYVLAGADYLTHAEVVSATRAEQLLQAGQEPGNKSSIGGHAGLGFRLFFTEAIAARVEFKDYVYVVDVPNWQEGGKARSDLQNQLFTELGISVFFPFHNRSQP